MDVVRKGYSVIKRISLLIAAAFMALTLAAPAAFAASPSQEYCENDLGGVFTRVNGEVKCVTTTTDVGKPHPKDKFTETIVETEQSQGTLNNDPQTDIIPDTSDCSDTGSGKCPKGQFPK